MIDRTNVGLSPLISTPVTTSFVTPVQTTLQTVPQTASFVQEAYPATTYGTQVVGQTVTVPQTTSLTQDALTSFAPQITNPDTALSAFIPETTPVQDVSPYPVTSFGAPQASTAASVVPNVVLTQQQVPQQAPSPAAAPIMDEDFQRGRPIYDEFSEDRYRNFKFGN